MALQNRVDPSGRIEANDARGMIMGNRGKLHDAHRRLTRRSSRINWIYCHLEFRGRHREVMHPRSYTELFFLDEPTALAAGHRPCAECRHPQYVRFQDAWAQGGARPYAAEMDTALGEARRDDDGAQRVHTARAEDLPDGTVIADDEEPWLVLGDRVHRWGFHGYTGARPRADLPHEVTVLTPRPIVAVLAAGFAVPAHPSAA